MSRKKNYMAVPRTGIVAEYLLDGNANATVGSNGTATNVTWGTDGVIGYQKGYGIFNGTNAYISNLYQVGHGTIYAFFTWVKYGNGLSITGGGSGQYYTFRLGQNATGLYYDQVGLGGTGGTYEITQSNKFINDGKWHLVGFIRNGTDKYLYLDNQIIASTIGGTATAITTAKSISLCGRYNGSTWVDLTNHSILLARWYSNYIPSQDEITNLYLEGLRKLGPTHGQIYRATNNDFPLYSLPNLENGKILEISKPKVGSNYINQVDGSSYVATNVSDSSNGLYNVMGFNGSSSYITIPDSAGLRPGTGDFYIRTTLKFLATSTKIALAKGPTAASGGGDYFAIITYNDGKIGFRLDDGTLVEAKSTNAYNNNKPHRVVGVRNGTTAYLYIDGVQVASVANAGRLIDNSANIVLGNFTYLNASLYYGGDIIIPDYGLRALSDTEILQDYYAHKIV